MNPAKKWGGDNKPFGMNSPSIPHQIHPNLFFPPNFPNILINFPSFVLIIDDTRNLKGRYWKAIDGQYKCNVNNVNTIFFCHFFFFTLARKKSNSFYNLDVYLVFWLVSPTEVYQRVVWIPWFSVFTKVSGLWVRGKVSPPEVIQDVLSRDTRSR